MSAKKSTFSVYASNFLSRSFNIAPPPPSTSSSSSQPLFYSVTEGSHLDEDERREHDHLDDGEEELDEDGHPRLTGSDSRLLQSSTVDGKSPSLSDSAPGMAAYLESDVLRTAQLQPFREPEAGDEDDDDVLGFAHDLDSIPLIASGHVSPVQVRKGPTPGWISHQSRNLSPPSSPSSSSSISQSENLTSSPPLPPPRLSLTSQLQESLLPRDGISRSLFHLPDPDLQIPARKYNDPVWTALWLTSVLGCAVGSVLILFVTNSSPKPPSSPTDPLPLPDTPYLTLTHTIPLLILVTIISALISYLHLILLRMFVRPVLLLTGISIPLFLFLSFAHAFAGSFFWEEGVTPTWSETVGLRIFSVVPLVLAFLSGRSFLSQYESIQRTTAVIQLSTTLLLSQIPVLLLSLGLLVAALIGSIPFLSLATRLLLIGYFSHPSGSDGWEWHVRAYAGWLILAVVVVWVWSWSVVRGVMRVVVSGVVGAWYFTVTEPESSRPTPEIAARAAFHRAKGISLGSICVAALVLTSVQSSLFVLRFLRRITTPYYMSMLSLSRLHPLSIITGLISILDSLSTYALVYVGISGEAFWASARKAHDLMSAKKIPPGRRKSNRRNVRKNDYTMVSSLLTLASLSISLFAAVGGYIFAAHSLSGPTNAPLSALLSGGVTFLTMRFGLALSEDAADALFLCYRLDVESGVEHRVEVFEAFEGRRQPEV